MAEAGEAEPLEPEIGLRERFAAGHAVQGEAEGDVVTRRLPRQEGVVLEQDGDVRRRDLTLDRSLEGCCRPITARRRLDLPDPDGPTRLTNWPSPTARLAPSSTGSPP